MNSKQKQIVGGGIVVLLLAVLAVGFFAFRPIVSSIGTYGSEQQAAEQQTAQLNTTASQLAQKEADLNSAASEYAQLSEQFPQTFQPRSWVNSFLAIGNETGVEVNILSPSVPASGTGAATVDANGNPVTAAPAQQVGTAGEPGLVASSAVQLTAEGTEAQIRAFIERLNDLKRPMLVDTLAYSTDNGKATVTITGKTFLLAELKDPSVAEEPGQEANPDAAPDIVTSPTP